MKFQSLTAAAVLALAPVLAHAASVTPDVTVAGSTTTYDYGTLAGNLTAPGGDSDWVSDTSLEISSSPIFAFEFDVTPEFGSLTQEVTNNSPTRSRDRAGSGETQLTVFGNSNAEYTLSFNGVDLTTVGDGDTNEFQLFIAAGQTANLVWTWSDLVPGDGTPPNPGDTGQVSTNLGVSEVPVPAGVLLMGTALAGFGVMRRKAKKAS